MIDVDKMTVKIDVKEDWYEIGQKFNEKSGELGRDLISALFIIMEHCPNDPKAIELLEKYKQ